LKNLRIVSVGLAATFVVYFFLYHSSFYECIDKWQIDKVFHLWGGYLIAVFAVSLFKINRLWLICLISFLFGMGWEIAERFLLHPWSAERLSLFLPILISWFDVAIDMIGVFIYWMLHIRKKINF